MIEATSAPISAQTSTAQVKRRDGKKLGWRGYASILRYLQRVAATPQMVAKKFDAQEQTVRRVLYRMHDLGAIHVQEWRQLAAKGLHVPVWAYGPGEDAPRPASQPSRRPQTLDRTNALPELVQTLHMLRLLEAEPLGKVELAARCGSQHSNVTKFVNHCHRIGLLRIADWSVRLHGGRRAALYGLGCKADAPKPENTPRREIAARSRTGRAQRQQHLQLIRATAAPVRVLAELREAA